MNDTNDTMSIPNITLEPAAQEILAGLATNDGNRINAGAEPIFGTIQHDRDWRDPVDRVLPLWLYGLETMERDQVKKAIKEAVEWFTATETTVQDLGDATVRITAAGYAAGPAA